MAVGIVGDELFIRTDRAMFLPIKGVVGDADVLDGAPHVVEDRQIEVGDIQGLTWFPSLLVHQVRKTPTVRAQFGSISIPPCDQSGSSAGGLPRWYSPLSCL